MRVTLKQLAVFDAVAKHNSINKAADEVSLSHSAVSVALKELESSLGVQLFERKKRTLHLNQNGRRLQSHARSILHLMEELEGRVKQPSLTGMLRLAAGATAGHNLLPPLCAQFMSDHPEVSLNVLVCSSAEVAERVDAMKQDIGFIDATINRSSLKVIPWIVDDAVIFCAPTHDFAGETVKAADLHNETWLMQPLGSFTRATLSTELRKFTTTLKVGIESNSIDTLKTMAGLGAGIGCLSRRLIQPELDRGVLAVINCPEIAIHRTVNIIVRSDVYRGEAISTFIDLCLKSVSV